MTDDYHYLTRTGCVERSVPTADDADTWRAAMRDACRQDRIRVRTVAVERRDDVYVCAWLPDRPVTDDEVMAAFARLRESGFGS